MPLYALPNVNPTPVLLSKSQRALVTAVISILRGTIGTKSSHKFIQDTYIDVGIDERVAPASADKAISVYVSTMARGDNGPVRVEDYTINVSLTARKKAIPSDNRGTRLLTDNADNRIISIQEVMEGIIDSIDGKIGIIHTANSLIPSNLSKFVTIPLFLPPNVELKAQEVGPEHFYTQPSDKRTRKVESLEGYLIEIPFSGARRYINTSED